MKTIKSILIAATLISASVVSTLSAQQAAQPERQWRVAIGDSVMIDRDCVKYSTGERPSVWVWDKVHTVRQLGTKKHPDGVLLMNIYSGICEDCLVPVSPKKAQPAEGQEAGGQETEGGQQGTEGGEGGQESGQGGQTEGGQQGTEGGESGQDVGQGGQQSSNEGETEIKEQGDTLTSKQNFKHNYDRFTIGVRGGAAGLLHQVQRGNWNCGFDAMLDLQYAHYWANDARPVDLGIIVGLGIGYSRSGMSATVDSAYTVQTDGYDIDYHLKADRVNEHDGQIQLKNRPLS